MNINNQTLKFYILISLIFILALGFRIFSIYQKDCPYHDEAFSFYNSTPSNLSPDGIQFKKDWEYFSIDYDKEYDVKRLKTSLFGANKSFKSIIKDLSTIRNQNIDSSHPILYYSLLRIWNSGYDGLSWQEAIYRGCFFNIILFCLSFFFMFKLLNLIKPNDTKFVTLGLLFAFFCAASISNTLLIREYALAEMLFNLSLYIGILIYKKIINQQIISIKDIFIYSFIFALLAQSGYFSLFYLAILASILIFCCIYFKNIKILKQLFIMFILTISIITIIYPKYFYYLFFNEHIAPKRQYILLFANYFKYIFYKPILFLIFIFSIFSKNKKYTKSLLVIILSVIIWNLIVIRFLHSYPSIRYIYPSIPILSFILLFFVYPLKDIFVKIIAVIYITISVIPLFYPNFKYADIQFLHSDRDLEYEINNNMTIQSKYPIVIHNFDNKRYNWLYTYYIFYNLNSNGKIIFTKYLPEKDFKYKKIYLMSMFLEKKDLDKYLLYKKAINVHNLLLMGTFGYYGIFYIEF